MKFRNALAGLAVLVISSCADVNLPHRTENSKAPEYNEVIEGKVKSDKLITGTIQPEQSIFGPSSFDKGGTTYAEYFVTLDNGKQYYFFRSNRGPYEIYWTGRTDYEIEIVKAMDRDINPGDEVMIFLDKDIQKVSPGFATNIIKK